MHSRMSVMGSDVCHGIGMSVTGSDVCCIPDVSYMSDVCYKIGLEKYA